jgi:hypothetical protein
VATPDGTGAFEEEDRRHLVGQALRAMQTEFRRIWIVEEKNRFACPETARARG